VRGKSKRKIIKYGVPRIETTNVIESVNSKFRKVTDARRVFPTDEAILKTLFMAALELEKKWTMSMRDWPIVYEQLVILFEDRLS
jgi:putative transposase